MHILYVIRDIDEQSGGPPRSCTQLAKSLVDQSVDVSILYEEKCNEKVAVDSRIRKIPLSNVGLRSRFSAKNEVADAIKNCIDENPDTILHLQGIWDSLTQAAARFAKKNGVPYVISPRGMLEPWSLQQKSIKKWIALKTYLMDDLQKATAIHATAESELKNVKALGLKSDVFVIPNGIPLAAVQERSQEKNDPRTALFLSRIHPKKGIELLIDAWKQLSPSGWNCKIVGPGEPSYISDLNSRISNSGLEETVTIAPPLDDTAKWSAYASSDLFVLPTYSENFGIVVAEALAVGLPVITTTGTPWTYLDKLGCGWCVEPSLHQVTDALASAFALNDNELRGMGRIGRNHVISTFDWDSIAKSFIPKYHTIGTVHVQ